MGSHGAKRRKCAKCVGLGAARAACAAGFEVEHTHLAKYARLARIECPTRRALGNFGVANIRLVPVQTVYGSIGKLLPGCVGQWIKF